MCLPQTVSEKLSGVTIRVYDNAAVAHILQPGQSVRSIHSLHEFAREH